MEADDDHYAWIVKKLSAGRIIPFLGAGANLCDRGDESWAPGCPFLPSGSELAGYLAEEGLYPKPGDPDLLRVSQYVDKAGGEDELYRYLREVFGAEYPPTSLHRLLARVARHLTGAGLRQLLTVTTNYDDLLEKALEEEGLEFDVVWYEAKQNSVERGKFLHRPPGGEPVVVAVGNDYKGLPMELERPVVLKLHGCLVRESADDDAGHDSYVITEDSYIDYLASGDVRSQIPIALLKRMTGSSFLFLGYSLSDWNMRVILNRIWGTSKLGTRSWAIQREPADPALRKIEKTLWDNRKNLDVELVFCELREYVQQLEQRLPLAAPATQS
jgi:SIR2-like domain